MKVQVTHFQSEKGPCNWVDLLKESSEIPWLYEDSYVLWAEMQNNDRKFISFELSGNWSGLFAEDWQSTAIIERQIVDVRDKPQIYWIWG